MAVKRPVSWDRGWDDACSMMDCPGELMIKDADGVSITQEQVHAVQREAMDAYNREPALVAEVAELRRALEDLHTAATEFAQEAECDCGHFDDWVDGHRGTFATFKERVHGECARAEKTLATAPTDAVRRVELLERYWYASNTPPAQRQDVDIKSVIEELRAMDESPDA